MTNKITTFLRNDDVSGKERKHLANDRNTWKKIERSNDITSRLLIREEVTWNDDLNTLTLQRICSF